MWGYFEHFRDPEGVKVRIQVGMHNSLNVISLDKACVHVRISSRFPEFRLNFVGVNFPARVER